jgi:hypothetical protein
MSAAKNEHGPLVVGGEPRIDFLPTETKKRKEYRRQRRSLVALVIVVAVACAFGFVFSTSLAANSQATLEAEQAKTAVLLTQQKEYAEVRTVQGDIDAATSARLVGSATEILWDEYVMGLVAGLPEGSRLTPGTTSSVTIDSQSTLELAPAPDVPLQNARVASIALLVDVTDLSVGDAVIEYLKTVPATADVTTTVLSRQPESIYRMTITLNVNSEAFERRFFVNKPADAPTQDEG